MTEIDMTQTPSISQHSKIPASTLERITLEAALYVGIFVLALFLRVFRLGLSPLSENEAAQAVSALNGTFLPAGGSPILYALNSFLFSLLSPSDALARLLPALAGSTLVLAPMMFRDALGRWGALGAAFTLTLSPIGLAASRLLDGEVIVVGCVLVMLALVRRYQATREERSLLGAAIALGVGLATGSGMVAALLALVLGSLTLQVAFASDSTEDEKSDTSFELRSIWEMISEFPNRTWLAGSLISAYILTATAGFTNLPGLGAASDLLTHWLDGFSTLGGTSAFEVTLLLILYESLALFVGIAGLLVALRRGDRFGAWLGFVAIIALAIVMLQPGRQPLHLLLPVTFLTLLVAYVVEPWFEGVRTKASMAVDGLIVVIGSVLLAVIMQSVASFIQGRGTALTIGPLIIDPLVVLLTTILVLPVAVGVLLYSIYDVRPILRAAMTVGLALLALGTLSTGWGATQLRVGDAREILWGREVTPLDVRNLVKTAQQIAIRAQGHIATLPILVEVDDPVLRWYLRDAHVPASQVAAGVVTQFGAEPQSLTGNWIGARFVTREGWDAVGLDFDTWLEWAVFRTSADEAPTVLSEVTLWDSRQ